MRRKLLCTFALLLSTTFVASCGEEQNNNQNGNVEVTKYSIQFMVDGKEYYKISSSGNEMINLPSEPTMDGKVFKGWFLDEQFTKPFSNDMYLNDKMENDLVIYAKMIDASNIIPVKKVANFYVDDELVGQSLFENKNQIKILQAPNKDGKIFDAWYLEKTFETKFDSEYIMNHDIDDSINLYAKYFIATDVIPIKKTISFYVDDTLYSQILTNGNEKITLPKVPTKENCHFVNWYTEENFINAFDAKYYETHELIDNIKLFAKFEANTYRVNFITNGGSSLNEINTNLIETSPITTKENNDFDGWYFEPTFINKAVFPLTITGDTTLYAKWIESKPVPPFEIDSKGMITHISDALKINETINIPDSIDGITVKKLDSNLFKGCTNLINLHMPNAITNIGMGCFEGCINLKTINFSESLNTISADAFYNCSKLTSVNLPRSVEYINSRAFANSGVESLTINGEVKQIGESAFNGCKNLKNVDLGKTIMIYSQAFANCENLTSIVLPSTLAHLKNTNIFINCTKLNEVTMPNNFIEVDSSIFKNTAFYNNHQNYSNGLLIKNGYLLNAEQDFIKETVSLPSKTKVIASNVFSYNNQIRTINLNEGLEVISQNAFKSDRNLSNITLPTTLKILGGDSLYDTQVLSSLKYENNCKYLNNWLVEFNNNVEENDITVVVKEGTIGIVSMKLFNFMTQDSITNVDFPSTLKYIGAECFRTCRQLTKIEIPDSVISIGSEAFYLTQVKNVTLKSTVILGSRVFPDDCEITKK